MSITKVKCLIYHTLFLFEIKKKNTYCTLLGNRSCIINAIYIMVEYNTKHIQK